MSKRERERSVSEDADGGMTVLELTGAAILGPGVAVPAGASIVLGTHPCKYESSVVVLLTLSAADMRGMFQRGQLTAVNTSLAEAEARLCAAVNEAKRSLETPQSRRSRTKPGGGAA